MNSVAVASDRIRSPEEKRARFESIRLSRRRDLQAACAGPQRVPGTRPIVELGCGHGHFLSALAAAHPECVCWGVDFCRDRIRRANLKQRHLALPNLSFVHAEVGEFLEALSPVVQFASVFVLFPDPWPKRRHKKNRLVTQAFLNRLAERVPAGGRLFFRSDSDDYFEEVAGLLARSREWAGQEDVPWNFDAATVFQEKAPTFRSLCAIRLS